MRTSDKASTRNSIRKGGTIIVDGPVFEDGKDPLAMRTIGEVAKALNIRPHVLRYWEEQFPALKPVKRSGSRRYYRPEDVAIIVEIDRLVHREGYTLRGASMVIDEKMGGASSTPAVQVAVATVQAAPKVVTPSMDAGFFQKLLSIRTQLAAGLAAA